MKNRLVRGLRGRFFDAARRLTPYVALEHSGNTFLLSTSDPGLGRPLYANRDRTDFWVLDRAVSFIEPRGVMIDVGANIGTTVVRALTHYAFARGLCYEPEPENIGVLRANIALNGLAGRVEVVEAAVSNMPGSAAFGRGPTSRAGRRRGVGALSRSARSGTVDVDVVTLDDDLAARGIAAEDIGLVWIDAQGHEGHVLEGARRLLGERRIPIVFALRPSKLRKVGGIEPLLERTEGYASFVDLRATAPSARPIGGLAQRAGSGPGTDILLF